jgi:hypothetical protein
MGGEPNEVGSAEATPSRKSWPLMSADGYQVRFTDQFLSQQRDMSSRKGPGRALIIFPVEAVLTAAALVMAWASRVGFLSTWATTIAAILIGIAMIVFPIVVMRRTFKVRNPELEATTPCAFVITPTTIEFPASRYHDAASWSRASTVATVTGDDWTRRLVLSYPGERKRFFVGWTMTDTPDDLAARIGRRISES